MDPVLTQTVIIGLTGLSCGAILAIAAHFLAVPEDPRIEKVTGLLPGLNCGACGFAGCADYAKAIVTQAAPVNLCQPGGVKTVAILATELGVQAVASERQVALVLCNGDDSQATRSVIYNGIADCLAAEIVGGSGKACRYGCMGLGTCARICPVSAIRIEQGLAIVDPAICIACGKCVPACPRNLIQLIPESRYIHVLCHSQDRGPDVKNACSVGCIACTICVKTCNGQGIAMNGQLAVVDYSVPLDNLEVIDKCPTHTIHNRTGRIPGKPA
jgi:Na+-translocating ferredoxin:NAD+ oxidoreductase RNF subunit RnfB